MRTILVPGAMLVLAGCHGAEKNAAEPAEPPANAVQVPDNAAAHVLALSDAERNAVLLRAIRDAGLACQGVTKAERVADQAGLPTWRADCDDGTQHLVAVAGDGTAKIVSRIGN